MKTAWTWNAVLFFAEANWFSWFQVRQKENGMPFHFPFSSQHVRHLDLCVPVTHSRSRPWLVPASYTRSKAREYKKAESLRKCRAFQVPSQSIFYRSINCLSEDSVNMECRSIFCWSKLVLFFQVRQKENWMPFHFPFSSQHVKNLDLCVPVTQSRLRPWLVPASYTRSQAREYKKSRIPVQVSCVPDSVTIHFSPIN